MVNFSSDLLRRASFRPRRPYWDGPYSGHIPNIKFSNGFAFADGYRWGSSSGSGVPERTVHGTTSQSVTSSTAVIAPAT